MEIRTSDLHLIRRGLNQLSYLLGTEYNNVNLSHITKKTIIPKFAYL